MTNSSTIMLYDNIDSLREACCSARAKGQRVALVPTMGALHRGHLTLIRHARSVADFVVVSIFVNPTQFGPSEDLASYPRTLREDMQGCEQAGADCVFAPTASQMYPDGETTRVHVSGLTDWLCGRSRPGHFDGVATIVSKLFVIVGPCIAVFGRKDYQQLKVIERLVKDMLFDVQVVGVPTVREEDGLALSSRNRYLNPQQRARARSISQGLADAVWLFDKGQRSAGAIRRAVLGRVTEIAAGIDYVQVADAETLVPIGDEETIGERVLVAVAIRVGNARLIDNVVVGQDGVPKGSES